MTKQAKHYELNRTKINDKRRKEYKERKENGLCIRCGEPVSEGSLWCEKHVKYVSKYGYVKTGSDVKS